MNWIQVGLLADIPRQGSRVINTATGEIALFRSVNDQVFALNNRCPHKGGPLSEGIVHGTRVTCPLHSWVIELESGEAVAPDKGCAHRHEVRVAHGVVFLEDRGLRSVDRDRKGLILQVNSDSDDKTVTSSLIPRTGAAPKVVA